MDPEENTLLFPIAPHADGMSDWFEWEMEVEGNGNQQGEAGAGRADQG